MWDAIVNSWPQIVLFMLMAFIFGRLPMEVETDPEDHPLRGVEFEENGVVKKKE